MAKGNLFLGQAKGKVGSVVFSRAFGQQITRTKPTSVKNPKTIGQNTQRAILATIAKEAALLTPIVDHSFANVTYGAESVRHFRKINMGILRNMLLSSVGVNYNLSAKGANAVPNALKISEGSLPAFSSAYQSDVVAFYQSGALKGISEVQVSDFKAAYPYLQGGDQLTLVKIVKTAGSLADGDAAFALKIDRMVFTPEAFDDPESLVTNDEGYINTNKLDLSKTTNTEMLIAQSGGAGNGLGCATDGDNTYAAALILSRKVNNVWQRSTQFLELTEFDDATNNSAAIDSYGASASIEDASEYLNQADESESSQGLYGSYMNAEIDVDGGADDIVEVLAGVTETKTIEAAKNTDFKLAASGYGEGNSRVTQVEIYDNTNTLVAHGNSRAYKYAAVSAQTAGTWKIQALFWDGTKAICNVTVSVKA